MRETGTVMSVSGSFAHVLFKRTSACGKCHACGMLSGQGSIIIKAVNDLEAKPGDTVIVDFTTKSAIGSSALAYVFPLIMLLAGLMIGLFVPVDFVEQEVFAAVLAIIMVGIAFAVLHFLEPVFKKVFANIYRITDIIN